MGRKDYLLQLIGSLSANEKRYFKLFSNIYPGDKRYLQLFDVLENKEQYDANELQKELHLDSKKLRDDKYYLNQMLLRSLANNEETSAEMGVYRGYLEAQSMLERRLFDYALEHAEKNIAKAKELELFLFLPNLISVKQNCLHGLQVPLEIPALSKELHDCHVASAEIFEIEQLRFAMAGFERMRNEPEMQKLSKHPILKKKVTELKSLRAQIAWFDIMSRYILFFDTPGEFRKLMKAEVSLYEKAPQVKVIDALAYLNSFAKMAHAEVKSGEDERALPWLEKLITLLDKPPLSISREKANALKNHALYYTSFTLRNLWRFEEALPFAKKSFEALGEGYLYEQYSFRFEYAVVLFHTGHNKEAADEVNGLLQLNTDMRSDLQLAVRPLMILVQLELGNTSVVPYLIKSAKAWLKRNKKSSKEADTFFRFTCAIAKASRAQLPQILQEFKAAEDKNLTGYLGGANLNLLYWIERQIARNKRAESVYN